MDETRVRIVSVRVTPAEYRALTEASICEDCTVRGFIHKALSVALGKKTEHTQDRKRLIKRNIDIKNSRLSIAMLVAKYGLNPSYIKAIRNGTIYARTS